ncbi:MAG: hypothetical protein RDV48_10060 [Candidatus Eremiobacteraeota bacterium]|nr:hypothetical protein [Candidatus Eremiobacteraeota bacterium]
MFSQRSENIMRTFRVIFLAMSKLNPEVIAREPSREISFHYRMDAGKIIQVAFNHPIFKTPERVGVKACIGVAGKYQHGDALFSDPFPFTTSGNPRISRRFPDAWRRRGIQA